MVRRTPLLRVISISLLTIAVFSSSAGASAQTSEKGPVVVELFTSEGCSSCPPADRMLALLQQQHTWNGTELILLGEHVDYWNRLGWKDRFSSGAFTARQTEYARASGSEVYTPEAVVDGEPNVVANDAGALEHAINKAVNHAKPARVTLAWSKAGNLQVLVENGGTGNAVLLFVTEDNLNTEVKAGENGGTTLHHAAVVREMRRIGNTKAGQFQADLPVRFNPDWQRKEVRVIVLVQQDNGAGKIVGAAALRPADETPQRRSQHREAARDNTRVARLAPVQQLSR